MKKVVLYGMGSWVENHFLWLKRNFDIIAAYDRDPKKSKKSEQMGFPFLTIEALQAISCDAVLITSTYVDEIAGFLVNELKINKPVLSGNKLYAEWEQKISDGKVVRLGDKFPGVRFSILQRGELGGSAGLFSFFNTFLREMMLAFNNERIPVIDLKNYWNIYHEGIGQVGKVNTWELFFKQPFPEYALDDVYHAQDVVFSDKRGKTACDPAITTDNVIRDLKLRETYHKIYSENIELSDRVREEYGHIYENVFAKNISDGDKVLGISVRGTDYTATKPYLHDIQPSLRQVCDKVSEVIGSWGITKIYVNSDEEKSIDYIKSRFPGKVFSMDYQRFDTYIPDNGHLLGEIRFEREDDAYRRGADYLMSNLLFTECDSFIGGVNSGCIATLIMKNTFEHEYIFDDLGHYGIDDDAYAYTPDGKPVIVNSTISVIILSYNNSEYFKSSIGSVLSQDYSAIELIVSDDGSREFNQEEIENYINSNKRQNIINVKILTSKTNEGVVKNYKKALNEASGKYIFYLAIDDELYDETVLTDVVSFFKTGGYDIFTGYRESFDASGMVRTEPYPHQVRVLEEEPLEKVLRRNIRSNMIAGACTPFCKSLTDKYGFVEDGYVHLEDWPRYTNLMENGIRIGFINRKLIRYRKGGITTQLSNKDLIRDYRKFMKKYRYEPYSYIFTNLYQRKYVFGWGCSGGFVKCYNKWKDSFNREIDFLIDKNQAMWGKEVEGIQVYPTDKLLEYDKKDVFILVFSNVYYVEIADELENMGYKEGEDFELVSGSMVEGLR